jgi:membrane protease YdiL (CAAX protease family)
MVAVSIISTVFAYLGINLIPDNALTEANYSSVTYCIVTFMYSCIVAPITEEMIFRGVVLRGFSVVSQRFGIFMSALLFGLLHGNVLQFITTFTVGMYLAYVATKYNSILPTIVIHFFINLVPTLTEMLLYNQGEEVENLVLLGFYGIMIVVGIVYMCLGFRKKSNRLPVQNASQRSRTTPVAFSSLGVLTIVTLYLITMVLTHVASL